MVWYPVQRQMLPDSTSRTSASSGVGLSRSSASEAMTKPGVQKPHWKAWRFAERLLQRIEVVRLAEALDGEHLAAARLDREHQARPDADTVDHHRARAADAVLTPEVGARELQAIAEEVGQRHPHFGVRPACARR